jgi:hypothetical protein
MERILVVGFGSVEEATAAVQDWSIENDVYLFTIVLPCPHSSVYGQSTLCKPTSYLLAQSIGAPLEYFDYWSELDMMKKIVEKVDFIIGKKDNHLAKTIARTMSAAGKHGRLV